MSNQNRGEDGQYGPKMTDQELLKVFDYSDDPMLQAEEVADGLQSHFGTTVTTEAVRQRLKRMENEGLVQSKEFGARAVGWAATVAPQLAPDVEARIEERKDSDEFTSL